LRVASLATRLVVNTISAMAVSRIVFFIRSLRPLGCFGHCFEEPNRTEAKMVDIRPTEASAEASVHP